MLIRKKRIRKSQEPYSSLFLRWVYNKTALKVFIESWNNEMVGVGGEKQRYKLTPGIRSSSGTRNSNKLLVDGGCCTQILRGVGEEEEEEGEDSFVEWRPCKWRAGALNPRKLECVYTGPGNFSRNPPHTHTEGHRTPFQYESSL